MSIRPLIFFRKITGFFSFLLKLLKDPAVLFQTSLFTLVDLVQPVVFVPLDVVNPLKTP